MSERKAETGLGGSIELTKAGISDACCSTSLIGEPFPADEVQLLINDICQIFKKREADRLGTIELLVEVGRIPERRWTGVASDMCAARQLAKVLRGRFIRPATRRFGNTTLKGYLRKDFLQAASGFDHGT